MNRTRLSPAQLLVVILSCIGAAYFIAQRKLPPFERGNHGSVVLAQSHVAGAAAKSPSIAGCPIFPDDNVWNTPVDHLPVDQHSADYIEIMRPNNKLHPDFGSNLDAGIPFAVIAPTTPHVRIAFEYRDDSDLGNYPLTAESPIEGGPLASTDSDRHVILIESQRCLLYELFAASRQTDGTWKAGSGIKMDLTSNALRAADKTSADAAGLPILPGLVRYEEVASGSIRHALRFTTTRTQAAYVWPARHFASPHRDPKFPPMGERFRLRANFDASGFAASDQVIITALKKYGMLLADNGGDMYISGVPDKRWSDSDLHKLSEIKASDFEAVDETGLQLLADSGRVDPR